MILWCVCPSRFDSNANKIRIHRIDIETSHTHTNVATIIPSDTMCPVINSGFRSNEPLSADVRLPVCPRAATSYEIDAKKRDIRNDSSLVIFKRLLYPSIIYFHFDSLLHIILLFQSQHKQNDGHDQS